MRVDLRTYGLDAPEKSKAERVRQSPAAEKREAEKTGADQASLSFDHARVQQMHAEAMAQPEIREQRVELLRQSIGKGEYAVSDDQVASALLNEFGGAK